MIKLLLVFLISPGANAEELCQYNYTVWNTRIHKAEGPFKITKPRSTLSKTEAGIDGCSVCESDQQIVKLSNNLEVKLCKTQAHKIKNVLEKYIQAGGVIKSLTGYRPSISKGTVDSHGRRTEFSRHAYGLAIDINENHNGLYDHCLEWGPSCRLIKGGKYSSADPLSILPDSQIVRLFREEGFQWGGKIHGFQKDFMHFSPDGL